MPKSVGFFLLPKKIHLHILKNPHAQHDRKIHCTVCPKSKVISVKKTKIVLQIKTLCSLFAVSFHFYRVGIYKEEVRDRLGDPLATWKIQGAKSCQLYVLSVGYINSEEHEFVSFALQ
jgi:hypothetical protein